VDQSIVFVQALEKLGCTAVHVSSGGLDYRQDVPDGPNYQVPFARALKRETKIPIIAVGRITSFDQAEAIVSTGDADLIALARAILFNPRWPWHAAAHFGTKVAVPDQYLRAAPAQHSDLFETKESRS
jgi:2,4-dienoyl-CoA reductase-like NADH-dependent reductase (Old Yellow Enzyme family)